MLKVNTNIKRISYNGSFAPMSRLFQFAEPLDTILPDCVRAFTGNADDMLFFVELPHGVYQIPWSNYFSGTSRLRRSYQLALPHILFAAQIVRQVNSCVTLRAFCPFFMNEPFTSLDQKLGTPVFPNVYVIGENCLRLNGKPVGNAPNLCHANVLAIDLSPLQAVRHAMNVFFGEAFNSGGATIFMEHAQNDRFHNLSSPELWARATSKDPRFILDYPWTDTGLSVRKLMAEHRKGQPIIDLLAIARAANA